MSQDGPESAVSDARGRYSNVSVRVSGWLTRHVGHAIGATAEIHTLRVLYSAIRPEMRKGLKWLRALY
jgi:hypothetical protein